MNINYHQLIIILMIIKLPLFIASYKAWTAINVFAVSFGERDPVGFGAELGYTQSSFHSDQSL